MRTWMLAAALLVAPSAFAQDPGDTVWLKADTDSARFEGDPTPGPAFSADEQVTVVFREGARIRVKVADKYGWIDLGAVTATAPEGARPPGGTFTLPPSLPR